MADEIVRCPCGSPTFYHTSWTRANPGRRFHCCARQPASCGFVKWSEPPLCRRASEIIPGLLERCNRNEAIARDVVNQNKKLKFLLGFTCIFVIVFIVIKMA